MKNKLGIIVPYRNRPRHLREFLRGISNYLKVRAIDKFNMDYEIIVVEQKDSKDFNRGKLLNIGFIEAEKMGCNYVVFHDIDMLPVRVDYSYSKVPLQLANNFEYSTLFKRTIKDDYFGGVTLFPNEEFLKINGYSNKYRGWGFEDDDLLYRCQKSNVPLKEVTYRSYNSNTKGIEFNGKSSQVKIPNKLTFVRPKTFYVSFNPADIICDSNEITDEYAVFGIPGEDLNLSYNSFKTYKFELFLVNKDIISITSRSLPNQPCRAVITIDPKSKRVVFYLNGLKVGVEKWKKYHIKKYNNEPYMYLGVADPEKEKKQKYFKGTIDSFAVFDRVLKEDEIRDLSRAGNTYLTEDIGRYKGKSNLELYYDGRHVENSSLIDLSGNKNNGHLKNCKTVDIKHTYSTKQTVPYRKHGLFKLLPHEEKGYTSGYWVNWKSRINQLRFYDIVNREDTNFSEDGLSTCKYKILEREEFTGLFKYTKLKVRS